MSAVSLPPGMTLEALCTSARLTGTSPLAIAEALMPAPEGECGWLDGTCHEPALDADWLCARHRAGMPSMQSGTHTYGREWVAR